MIPFYVTLIVVLLLVAFVPPMQFLFAASRTLVNWIL
jgi:hypothetical protein